MSEETDSQVRVFDVETRFQSLAKRPGGVARGVAIEEANLSIERMKPGFGDWAESELHELSTAIERARTGEPNEEWLEAASLHARAVLDVGTTMGANCSLSWPTRCAKSWRPSKQARAGTRTRSSVISMH
jgi:hypothetical protein